MFFKAIGMAVQGIVLLFMFLVSLALAAFIPFTVWQALS